MWQLLRIEWLKIKNYTTFWVLMGLYAVSMVGINVIVGAIFNKAPKDPLTQALMGGGIFSFPQVWQTVTYFSGLVLFMPGLLIIIHVTNEYNFKTHRQNIIDGVARKQYILVKLISVLLVSLFSTLLVLGNVLGFGFYQPDASFSADGIHYLGIFFMQCFMYCSLALLLSVLLKRSGIVIGLFFLYSTIIENMLAGITNEFTKSVGYFFPLESVDKQIPFPIFREIAKNMITPPPTHWLMLTGCIYIALFMFITHWRFQKADL
ncbi:MAG: hypothetical protein EAZ47_03230 [Bacteroidetes bacterium]|nr:MAG: hypothetical protein EAY72_03870 [Bacteroidota bacterium]TAE64544.1 MAG: hypothetical protein EAY68_07110 [Bacteroidota bacterium]TAF95469.1 MAG: hypothetical protein EAZ47_03230 [Bacteroidota bacterium]